MNTNPRIDAYSTLCQNQPTDTCQTLLSPKKMVPSCIWSPKEFGTYKIDVNISLYDSNFRRLTSVSSSSELNSAYEEEARQLTLTFAKGMEELLSKV